jgi:hypothetical protein
MTRGRAAAAPPTKKTKLTERPFCSYLGEGIMTSGVRLRNLGNPEKPFANNNLQISAFTDSY